MSDTKNIQIMVIEDSLETSQTLKDIFEVSFSGSDTPCNVLTVHSGETAFKELEKGLNPNFIILDINLPGMNGAAVLKKLKDDQRWKDIPVFPYSSLWDEKSNAPADEHMQIVKEWYEAVRHSSKIGGGNVEQVIPKYKGQESTSVIHPRLIVFVASILIRQGFELSLSFKRMVNSARKMIEETKA